MLNSRRGALIYSFANSLLAAIGLKLPPINTSSFASDENSGSTRAANAIFVNGPAAIIVTCPGNSCTFRIMKLMALSLAALIVGAPAGDGGTTDGSACGGERFTVPSLRHVSVHAPL